MTEEAALRDYEAIAASLPQDPYGLGQLRALLGSLPSPNQPDVRAARAGSPDTGATGGSGPGAGLTLQSSLAVGQESGSASGVTPIQFFAKTNLLENPTMIALGSGVPALTAISAAVGPKGWTAKYVVVAGPAPTSAAIALTWPRTQVDDNPFNSSLIELDLQPSGAGTIDLYLEQAYVDNQGIGTYPFLVAAARLTAYGTVLPAQFTTVTAFMELVNTSDGITYTSTPLDIGSIDGTTDAPLVAVAGIAGAFKNWTWRLRLRVVSNALTGGLRIAGYMGEPALQYSFTQQPNPYSPVIGAWIPDVLEFYSAATDSQPRVEVGTNSQIGFGSGAAITDVRLSRTAAAILRIDNAVSNVSIEQRTGAAPASPPAGYGRLYFGADKHYHQIDDAGLDTDLTLTGGSVSQVSRDAVAASSDYVARIRITTDTTFRAFLGLAGGDQGTLEFGPGGVAARDVRIFRNGARQLTIDTNGGAGNFNVAISSPAANVPTVDLMKDGEANPTLRLVGSGGSPGISTGPGGGTALDLRLYRSAAKTWTADDTAGGNITFNVLGTLQQAGTGVSVIGHGAGDHADITRKLFLNAELATLDAATFASLGASPDQTRVVAYADAATQGAFWDFMVPSDWASGVITIQPIWSPGATDAVAHTVRWSYVAKAIAAGSTVTAAGTTVTWTGASAARTVGVVVYDTATSTTLTPAAAGDAFRIEVRRIGADAADTYVGVVNLIGLIVSYTANQ